MTQSEQTEGAWIFHALFLTMDSLNDQQNTLLQELSINCFERSQLARDLAAHLYQVGLLIGENERRSVVGWMSEEVLFALVLWCLEGTAIPEKVEEWTRLQRGWYGDPEGARMRVIKVEGEKQDEQPAVERDAGSSDTPDDQVSRMRDGYTRPQRVPGSSRAARSTRRTRWGASGPL